MDQSSFLKRFYAILGTGACVLLILTWVFIKGGLSPRGFGLAALIWWIVMFVPLFNLFRSRQRSAEDIRRKQIASGVPAEMLDRDRCLKNIRSMKRFIAFFAILLAYGVFATQGNPLLTRAMGASVDLFFLALCIYSLIRSQKRLKNLPADRTPNESS